MLRELEKLKNVKTVNIEDSNKNYLGNDVKMQELKLDDYVRRASLQRAFSQEEKDKILVFNQGSTKSINQNDKKQLPGVAKKRVQKVRPEDVKDIGYEINLRLRIKKITFEDIEKVFNFCYFS